MHKIDCNNTKSFVFIGSVEYDRGMLKSISFLLVLAAVAAKGADESQVWNLEKAYWEYVKINDLEKYRALWHDDFVGWPSISPEPLRKDKITDWIKSNILQGLKLQSYAIE